MLHYIVHGYKTVYDEQVLLPDLVVRVSARSPEEAEQMVRKEQQLANEPPYAVIKCIGGSYRTCHYCGYEGNTAEWYRGQCPQCGPEL